MVIYFFQLCFFVVLLEVVVLVKECLCLILYWEKVHIIFQKKYYRETRKTQLFSVITRKKAQFALTLSLPVVIKTEFLLTISIQYQPHK